MMRPLVFSIVWLHAAVKADCSIPLNHYETAVSAETTTYLYFAHDQTFKLYQLSWTPGRYEYRSGSLYYGIWHCQGHTMTLSFDKINYQAELTAIGANPLGYSEQSKVLLFDPIKQPNTVLDSILSRQLFYPESIIENDKD